MPYINTPPPDKGSAVCITLHFDNGTEQVIDKPFVVGTRYTHPTHGDGTMALVGANALETAYCIESIIEAILLDLIEKDDYRIQRMVFGALLINIAQQALGRIQESFKKYPVSKNEEALTMAVLFENSVKEINQFFGNLISEN